MFANGGRCAPNPLLCFNTMQAGFKYLRTSKDRTHIMGIWTLSEPVIKVFANGGGAAPRPTPPLFFCAMQFWFLKTQNM